MDQLDTSSNSTTPSRNCLTCLTFLICLTVALPLGISYLQKQARLNAERVRAKWRQKWFDDVKNGGSWTTVMDVRLLHMLADEAECIANLKGLSFAGVKIAPADAEYVSHLSNVKQIGFYDTLGADHVLKHARQLPVESLYFEVTRVSHDSLRALAEFPLLKEVHFEQVIDQDSIAILRSLPAGVHVEWSQNERGSANRSEPTAKRQSK